jgi:hypothetical protein
MIIIANNSDTNNHKKRRLVSPWGGKTVRLLLIWLNHHGDENCPALEEPCVTDPPRSRARAPGYDAHLPAVLKSALQPHRRRALERV